MKWIKKPIVVEAEQYKEYGKLVKGMCNSVSCYTQGNDKPHVHTIHNNQIVLLEVGDYIIPEPDGEHYYPCKPDIFEKTYSPFDESINQEGSLKDSDWKDMWYSNSKRTKVHSEIEEDIEWIEQNVAVPLKETNKEILGRWVATLDENKALQNKIKELENVIAPLLQKECKGDDLVAEQPVSSKMEHTEIGGSSENGRWVNRREREPEKTGKYKIRYALTDFDDSFEEAEETYYNQSGWNKHGYAQFVMAWWEESNTKEHEEKYYPGIQYQRLFNAISETKGIPTQSDMDEIIRIVHEDFPLERLIQQ